MSLPQMVIPTFQLKLPSNNKSIKYRPFLVKEQKLLYIALESGEEEDIVLVVKDVLKSCIESKIDINKLATFDLEYLFLNIRAKSVGEAIELKFAHVDGKNSKDEECDHQQEHVIDINEIKVPTQKKGANKIALNDEIGVVLRYPTVDDMPKYNLEDLEDVFNLILDCVESVWDAENTTLAKDETRKNLREWVETFNEEQFNMILEFFKELPTLKYEAEYTCEKCGDKQKIYLEGLYDFFV